MLSVIDRHVIARESNVVRVDFSRDPDPPAPCFPGANGLRPNGTESDGVGTPPVAVGAGGPDWASRFRRTRSAAAQGGGLIPR
jgi:hypothetical protein